MRKKTAHMHSSFLPSLITGTHNEALLFLIVSAASLNVLGRPWLLRDTDPSIFDLPATLKMRFCSRVKDVHVGAKWQEQLFNKQGSWFWGGVDMWLVRALIWLTSKHFWIQQTRSRAHTWKRETKQTATPWCRRAFETAYWLDRELGLLHCRGNTHQ